MSIAEWLDTGKVNDLPILSAKEARMLTEKYMEETIASQQEKLALKIAYAAKNGDESVTLEGTFKIKNVREKLEKDSRNIRQRQEHKYNEIILHHQLVRRKMEKKQYALKSGGVEG